jgi:CBS-domain-containing membrane protein
MVSVSITTHILHETHIVIAGGLVKALVGFSFLYVTNSKMLSTVLAVKRESIVIKYNNV